MRQPSAEPEAGADQADPAAGGGTHPVPPSRSALIIPDGAGGRSGRSAVAQAASDAALNYNKLYWDTNALATNLTERGLPNFVRSGPYSVSFADRSAEFVINLVAKELGKQPADLKVWIEHEESIYGTSIAEHQRPASNPRQQCPPACPAGARLMPSIFRSSRRLGAQITPLLGRCVAWASPASVPSSARPSPLPLRVGP